MKDIPNKLEAPARYDGVDSSGYSRQGSRRKRSPQRFRSFKRRLDKMLSMRNFIRALLVLLPLAGFLYITVENFVFSPGSEKPESLRNAQAIIRSAPPTESYAETLKVESGETAAYQPDAEPKTIETNDSLSNVGQTSVYAINEGGSVWRTARRFIDDAVLLDKLIDSLEENGMDVRRIRPGVEFVVKDMGSEGLLVTVEDRGEVYQSRIFAGSVTTSVLSKSEVETDSSQTAFLGQ